VNSKEKICLILFEDTTDLDLILKVFKLNNSKIVDNHNPLKLGLAYDARLTN